ncbi:MAG: hypothetical protein ACYSOX_03280, partial [Planctomycetota bacterium]
FLYLDVEMTGSMSFLVSNHLLDRAQTSSQAYCEQGNAGERGGIIMNFNWDDSNNPTAKN